MNREAVVALPKIAMARSPGSQLAMGVSESPIAPDANGVLDLSAQATHPPGCPCCTISKPKMGTDVSQNAPVPDHGAAPATAFVTPAAPAATAAADVHHAAAVFAPSPHVTILGGLGEHLHI